MADPLSSTDGAGRERYELIRDERILWVNVTTDELHAAYDVARDARDVDTAVRIAVQVFERNSELLPDPELVALRERTRVLEEALRDETHNRASAAKAAQCYGYALSAAVDAWEAEFGGNEEPTWVTAARASLAAVAVEDEPEGAERPLTRWADRLAAGTLAAEPPINQEKGSIE